MQGRCGWTQLLSDTAPVQHLQSACTGDALLALSTEVARGRKVRPSGSRGPGFAGRQGMVKGLAKHRRTDPSPQPSERQAAMAQYSCQAPLWRRLLLRGDEEHVGRCCRHCPRDLLLSTLARLSELQNWPAAPHASPPLGLRPAGGHLPVDLPAQERKQRGTNVGEHLPAI